MKTVILLLLGFTFLLSAGESCYSVQLTSVYKTEQNSSELKSKKYDNSCKVMEIGSNIVVRCGCFSKFKEANAHLREFAKKYKDAYVLSTYRSRFENENSVVAPITKPLLAQTFALAHKTEVLDDIVPAARVLDVSSVQEGVKSEQVVVKQSKAKKTQKSKVKKKNKLKKKKKSKAKKKKKKLKKQSRAQQYGYNRYLKKLQNNKARGKYKYKYKFGAQISYDMAYVNEADQSYTSGDFRRIRVYHQGSFWREKLFYELEYSFTGSNKFKDNFVGYKNHNKTLDFNYRIKTGNIRIPFSLERYTSSKNNMFMERALTDAYAEGRQLGAELLLHKKFTKQDSANLFLSLFTSSIDERLDEDIIKQGYSVRGTYAHKWRKNHLLSIGSAYFSQNINGDKVNFNETAESYLMQNEYISASIKNANRLTKNNIELLYIYDNYSLQSEYTQVGVDAINKSTHRRNNKL
ncbi:MAG: porin [Sulfurimonas sp.]|nr:porin [Sulfurimonas sp.]